MTGEFNSVVTKWPIKYNWDTEKFAEVLDYAQTTASPTQLKPSIILDYYDNLEFLENKTTFSVDYFTNPDSPLVPYTNLILEWIEQNVDLTPYEEESN